MLNTIFLYTYLFLLETMEVSYKEIDNNFWVLTPCYRHGSWTKSWLVVHKKSFPKKRYLLEFCILLMFGIFSADYYEDLPKL